MVINVICNNYSRYLAPDFKQRKIESEKTTHKKNDLDDIDFKNSTHKTYSSVQMHKHFTPFENDHEKRNFSIKYIEIFP